MAMIHESVQVNVPLRTAYNQWTQFEQFPQFVKSLHKVHQLDDSHVHWEAEIWGKDMAWDAEITRQIPDKLIEWKTMTGGPDQGGFVEFRPLDSNKTEVNVHINYEPEGVAAKVGNVFGVAEHRVHNELDNYKSFIENRGSETGAWRGEIGSGAGSSASSAGSSGEWARQDSCEDD